MQSVLGVVTAFVNLSPNLRSPVGRNINRRNWERTQEKTGENERIQEVLKATANQKVLNANASHRSKEL